MSAVSAPPHFNQTAVYTHTLEALRGETITPNITTSNISQWAMLGWFMGMLTTFATHRLMPFAQHLRADIHAHALSLASMALDLERFFMGTAVVLITINRALSNLSCRHL